MHDLANQGGVMRTRLVGREVHVVEARRRNAFRIGNELHQWRRRGS
jgi:hypothetical protein